MSSLMRPQSAIKSALKPALAAGLMASALIATLPARAADTTCPQGACDSAWKTASKDDKAQADAFGETYKAFLDKARTELLTVAAIRAEAERNGFEEWKPGTPVTPGAKYFHINRDRAMALIIGGSAPTSAGLRIVASHIDSPRLELKGRPVDEAQGFALFQTNYHGGIKTYQWTNIPLALVGRVDTKDGKTVQISIGLKGDDPILMIPDLSPHTARDQMKKNAREVVEHEDLDPIVAHGPHGEDGKFSASEWVFRFLKSNYDIEAADLVSAELSLVPAMKPRDMGLDRRLVAAYGQDDRLAAFASMMAAFDTKRLPHTTIIQFADNEESGNVNVSGASSTYLPDLVSELVYAELGEAYRQPLFTRALRASKALSIDVNPGVNPMSPSAWELTNAPRLGFGVNIKLYGRGFDANSEFIAWTRAALDDANVAWQTTTYKVGRAGGGTLGKELAKLNIDTIDFGVPLLSIHTPVAVSDKMDVLALKNAISAFISKAD
ncbi:MULTISPECIES: aminopeptidase 1 [Kordiimonas]|jgi:aspartyl aminopeptidase|uniref:aminopeptidase 1 n=1 Tax=Kordiimonas TaxID=288021 RepID=UPI00257CAD77|nr:aminopeptidase 1 [Kordiimonas sp. UBA4487]